MTYITDLYKSLFTALWFMFLTFPIMAIKVNAVERVVVWRWNYLLWVGLVSFGISFLYRALKRYQSDFKRKNSSAKRLAHNPERPAIPLTTQFLQNRTVSLLLYGCGGLLFLCIPTLFNAYQTSIMISALMYVMLGLGLNIVVGVAGLLDLGYVAFYAVGAYSYALLHLHFGLGFWTVLPLAGLLAALFGILLGFPVLRLRGDYLAIVTLGFGEIIRLVLENWGEFTHGPSGIPGIPKPGFFGMELNLSQSTIYLYYVTLALVCLTIFVVNRLQNSRIGRAWYALREDDIACQAMGIDKTKTKLMAFALGATWAGMAGVVFAAKTTFVNPKSFEFIESAMILSIVVLGGMGSIVGVIIGALLLSLMPEYLRFLSEYRMLIFGALLVIMMRFRPQGLIANIRRTYTSQS